MPAPTSALPSWIVSPESVTPSPEAVGSMANTRLVLLPLTVAKARPGPVTVTLSSIVNWPEVSTIVCGKANAVGSKVIEPGPAAALASRIACRSEPAPASLGLKTTNTVGTTRPSNV